MNKKQIAATGESRLLAFALVALGALGCTATHVQWRDTSNVVQPQGSNASAVPEPHGYLVVEMSPRGQPGDQEMQHYPPVYLYDRDGRYLAQLPNNTEYPRALRSGEYIVLIGEDDPLGPFRQLQVRVDDGRTTTVTLADIGHTPWE